MHAAAQRLLGKHDFTTFRDTECQAKSPEKTLDQLDVVREGDDVAIVTSARSFLHSQVRSMVGSLVWVGEGRWSADDLAAALAARNRAACGPVAPPDGLVSGAGGLLRGVPTSLHARGVAGEQTATARSSRQARGARGSAAARLVRPSAVVLDRPPRGR